MVMIFSIKSVVVVGIVNEYLCLAAYNSLLSISMIDKAHAEPVGCIIQILIAILSSTSFRITFRASLASLVNLPLSSTALVLALFLVHSSIPTSYCLPLRSNKNLKSILNPLTFGFQRVTPFLKSRENFHRYQFLYEHDILVDIGAWK